MGGLVAHGRQNGGHNDAQYGHGPLQMCGLGVVNYESDDRRGGDGGGPRFWVKMVVVIIGGGVESSHELASSRWRMMGTRRRRRRRRLMIFDRDGMLWPPIYYAIYAGRAPRGGGCTIAGVIIMEAGLAYYCPTGVGLV